MHIKLPAAELERSHPAAPSVPPLQMGDHLSAAEFERRFDAMSELKKAELIEGIVYMPSPVSIDHHGEPHTAINGWLFVYQAYTPGTQAADNSTVRLDDRNEPQPDVLLRILPAHGGRTTTADGYVVGGPELAAEVAASSASYDLHSKLQVYYRHGIQEYVVWRVWDRTIDWFVRGEGQYELLPPDGTISKSRVFPGLWLDAAAMIAGNPAQVLAVLQQGLTSPEHAAFAERLRQAAPSAGN